MNQTSVSESIITLRDLCFLGIGTLFTFLVQFIIYLLRQREERKYKSVEFLDKEVDKITDTKKEMITQMNQIETLIKDKKNNINELKEKHHQLKKLYYTFFNSLESISSKVQIGIISGDYFERKVGNNIVTFANIQIDIVRMLKEIADRYNIPFGIGRKEDTYRNFYQIVGSRLTREENEEINNRRGEIGLPSYNRLTCQIEIS